MSNAVALRPQTVAPALQMDERDLMNVLRNSLYPGASDDSIKLVIGYCKASGLDPMQKPVHIVPMWDKEARVKRDVVLPGIGLYRTQAARSGQFAGMSEPEFGPDVTENIGGAQITYPAWCRVTVRRQLPSGQIADFLAVERWRENYAVKGGKEQSIAPNAMWARRPYAQLAKCAEAQALRKAFPEVGATPTAEEMEGSVIDADVISADTPPPEQRRIQAPRSKSKTPPEGADASSPAADERPQTSAAPESRAGVSDGQRTEESPPAPAGQINLIRKKAEMAGTAETELCAKFEVGSLEAITVAQGNAMLKHLANG